MDHDYLIKLIGVGESRGIMVYDTDAPQYTITKKLIRAMIVTAYRNDSNPTKLIIDYDTLVDGEDLYSKYIPEYTDNLSSIYHLDEFYIMGIKTKFVNGLDRNGKNTVYVDYYINTYLVSQHPSYASSIAIVPNGIIHGGFSKNNLVVLECDHGKSAILGAY